MSSKLAQIPCTNLFRIVQPVNLPVSRRHISLIVSSLQLNGSIYQTGAGRLLHRFGRHGHPAIILRAIRAKFLPGMARPSLDSILELFFYCANNRSLRGHCFQKKWSDGVPDLRGPASCGLLLRLYPLRTDHRTSQRLSWQLGRRPEGACIGRWSIRYCRVFSQAGQWANLFPHEVPGKNNPVWARILLHHNGLIWSLPSSVCGIRIDPGTGMVSGWADILDLFRGRSLDRFRYCHCLED